MNTIICLEVGWRMVLYIMYNTWAGKQLAYDNSTLSEGIVRKRVTHAHTEENTCAVF